jgi:hypothetical protein
MEIKNILGHELGAHMRFIHEKNQRPKISCSCTFKGPVKIKGLFKNFRVTFPTQGLLIDIFSRHF